VQFLYKIQPVRPELLTTGPTEDEKEIISQHFSYLKALMDNGTVILAGRTLNTDSSSFGIVIFNSESADGAHQILHEAPAVKNNVFNGEMFPYRIALLNEGNVKE
jgi:uncharacterized protein YciI